MPNSQKMNEGELRAAVRLFLSDEYPQDILSRAAHGDILCREDHLRSQRALHSKGWLAPGWPQKYGGGDWDGNQRQVLEEELDASGVPLLLPQALIYVGPVIYTFGTDEQKRRWLPDILESKALWAQGYSEPEAGSDLGAIGMTAVCDGDHYILNGTKIWTSYAHWADWIFCLARTSREERRQDGISFICAAMDSPGITVNPIVSVDGLHHLNRVEFQNVRVPVSQMVGEIGKGWSYAMFLLQRERLSYAHVARKRADLRTLRRLAETTPSYNAGEPMSQDKWFERRFTQCEMATEVLDVSVRRAMAAGDAVDPAAVSVLKIAATELAQRITELFVEIAGPAGAVRLDRRQIGWSAGAPLQPAFASVRMAEYLFERGQTIYGGATEVQKNIAWRAINAQQAGKRKRCSQPTAIQGMSSPTAFA